MSTDPISRIEPLLMLLLVFGCSPALGQPVEGESRFYVYEGERIPLMQSRRYLAVESGGFDDGPLNTSAFTTVQSPVAERHGLVLVRRNDDVEDELFDEALRNLLNAGNMGYTFSAGDVDLLLVNEFTIAFQTIDSATRLLRDSDIKVIRQSRYLINHYLISFQDVRPIDGLGRINEMAGEDGVSYAFPNFTTILPGMNFEEGDGAPSDLPPPPVPEANESYLEHLAIPLDEDWPDDFWFDYQKVRGMDTIRAPESWRATIGGCEVKIAVLDDGVDLDHPDLKEKIVGGYDFMEDDDEPEPHPYSAHGTAVAGVLGAMTHNDELGVAGTMWGGGIVPFRIYYGDDIAEQIDPERAIAGIEEAVVQGARVINSSWSIPMNEVTSYWYNIEPVIDGAIGDGAILVFSVGNDGAEVNYPSRLASTKDIISVGFTDEDGDIQVNSNGGPDDDSVSVVAPGMNVTTTDIAGVLGWKNQAGYFGDYIESFGDSSAAAPFVSGAAGLLVSWDPSASPADVKEWIVTGATGPSASSHGAQWGSGILDIAASIDLVGVTNASIAGSLAPNDPLAVGESSILQVSITRNGKPLSGALVHLTSNDASLATISTENEYLVSDCNGIVSATVTGKYAGVDHTVAFIQASIYGKTEQISVVVGGILDISWWLFIAMILAGLILLTYIFLNWLPRFSKLPTSFE